MTTLTKNDLRLLSFLYKNCKAYKYYPHIIIAIEDMGACGLSERDIKISMHRLNSIYTYNSIYEIRKSLFYEYFEWKFNHKERIKDNSLPSMFFDINLNVTLAHDILLKYATPQIKTSQQQQKKP